MDGPQASNYRLDGNEEQEKEEKKVGGGPLFDHSERHFESDDRFVFQPHSGHAGCPCREHWQADSLH
jgi:hypothetical protein